MKRFKTHLLTILIVLNLSLAAQQDPMYSMYMFDKMLINPAFTGSSNWMVATLKYRNQFVGFDGHPTTQTFNFHTPVPTKHMGIGFKIINDKRAVMSNLNASISASYHLNFAGGKLSLGLDGGIYSRKIDFKKLIVSDQNDKAIVEFQKSAIVPDVSYGLYFQKKQFYVGISQNHLIKKTFNYNESSTPGSRLYNHLYIIAGNVFTLNKNWSVEPSMLLKYQKASKPQLDLNTMIYYDDKFGVGLQYRTGDALVTMFRVNITENLRLAYSYDLTMSKLSNYSKGSHEIILSYGIKLPPPPLQKEIHPRYYF